MAKTFNQIYKESKAQVYSNSVNSLLKMAAGYEFGGIPGVEFTPILAPNGGSVITATSGYNVQRRERPVTKDVANANAGTTSSALALLDSFPKTNWVTLPVATGKLQSVGFQKTFKDDYDFSNDPQHARDIMYQTGEIAVKRHKDLLALLETATATGAAVPAYVKGDTKVWDAIADEVITLAQVDDKFADVQGIEDFVIVTGNKIAKDLAKENGISFNQEAPIADTGFTSKKSVNGTPVIIDQRLSGRECYIVWKHSIAFTKAAIDKDINVDLGLVEYTGKIFYDVMTIVDDKRIAKISV